MTRLEAYRFVGRTAVLTGVASGIGEEPADGPARRGSDLIPVDVDRVRLEAVAARSAAVEAAAR